MNTSSALFPAIQLTFYVCHFRFNCVDGQRLYRADFAGTRVDGFKQSIQMGFPNFERVCSGLMKPDTHLGENARQIEVSDDQTTPLLYS
ncbi:MULTISPECIES: hypothetical protein [unclassified Pseudomonas]|uniref:hypothetical protein n=1 Tax=unclassified Pseudomonas TaxID=196821 RepID=UPI00117AD505|nr:MULTISPECIES: hypothetical protein [unclassified Pseudomonas]